MLMFWGSSVEWAYKGLLSFWEGSAMQDVHFAS